MNKLKGELCAFCMIFSAIITYSDASYKEDLLKQAGHIAEDLRKEAEGIVHGVHPFLDEKDAGETEKNINNYLKNLKYSDEKIKQLKIEAYGSEKKDEIQEKLEKENTPIIESILDASLRGDIEIPYWYTKDDPAKPFDEVSDATKLSSGNIALSKLVEFAHDLRTVGYTPTEFLTLYAEPCDSSKDLSSGRCDPCKVHQTVEKVIQNKLSPYKDIFYKFVNVMRSIGNNVTYTLMREALLYGDAKGKTPDITKTDSADAADLFNFLHIVLQEAKAKTTTATPGKETSIQEVAYNWLTQPIDSNLTTLYPKVVNTLVDMMYIAHVAGGLNAVKNIGQKKRHILSQEALKRLNVALEEIGVGSAKYRLVGINDLRIATVSQAVLGLDNSIVGNATSFLLPVAVLQNKSSTSFATYNGAPLLMASDIVYMVRNKKLPIVSMFFEKNKLISTYRTGYNLMKQSILITDVTHDGSYNNTVTETYGIENTTQYTKEDWNLENETTTIAIYAKTASLIVAELFSWYTKQLDVSGITDDDLGDRSKYEAEFKKATADTQAAHAFIVHNSNTVTNISNTDALAYTPDTVYKENSEYTNKHYISKAVGGTTLTPGEQKITGEHLIASLLNSSWGETMLRAEDKELVKFKNITPDSEIDTIGKASEFNAQTNRGNNKSSTVHVVTEFENALQKISNYTFPGFQPRESAYGRPLATLGEKAKETTPGFITENADGSSTRNIILQDNKALETALGTMGAK